MTVYKNKLVLTECTYQASAHRNKIESTAILTNKKPHECGAYCE